MVFIEFVQYNCRDPFMRRLRFVVEIQAGNSMKSGDLEVDLEVTLMFELVRSKPRDRLHYVVAGASLESWGLT